MPNMYEGLIATCPECGDEVGACEHRWGNTPEGKAWKENNGLR